MGGILDHGVLHQRCVAAHKALGHKSAVVGGAFCNSCLVGGVVGIPALQRLHCAVILHQLCHACRVVLTKESPCRQQNSGVKLRQRGKHIADRSNSSKPACIAAGGSPSHQAAVGVTGGIHAGGIDAVILLHAVQQAVDELQIHAGVGILTGHCGKGTCQPHGGGNVAHQVCGAHQTLREDHDKAVLLCHIVPAGLLCNGIHGGGITVHHQHQRHLFVASIGGRHIDHPAAQLAVDPLLVNIKATPSKVLCLCHAARQLQRHKALELTGELFPDGCRALCLFGDPHLGCRTCTAADINTVTLCHSLVGFQVELQRCLIGRISIGADEPNGGIHRLCGNGFLLHAAGGVAGEWQHILTAHCLQRGCWYLGCIHSADGTEITCPASTE